jgi:lysozyme
MKINSLPKKESDRDSHIRPQMVVDCIAIIAALAFAAVWAFQSFMTSPPYIDFTKYPIKGIDVSAHNGMINYRAVADDGYSFVFIKASEGKSFTDENFHTNYTGAKKAGLKVGFYHFFRFDVDGVAQAVNFLNAIGDCAPDLALAVDVEKHGNPDNVDIATITDNLSRMVEYLNLKGHRVMFYSTNNGYYDYLESDFKGQPLWVCAFSNPPINADWDFWQFSHSGSVKGVDGKVDLDVFYGSHEEWYDYLLGRYDNI